MKQIFFVGIILLLCMSVAHTGFADGSSSVTQSDNQSPAYKQKITSLIDKTERDHERYEKYLDSLVTTHERFDKLLDRQQIDLERYEKILSAWEKQQAEYQKYLDGLKK